MNLRQEAIYHNLVLASIPIHDLSIQEQQEILQTFFNRMNTRIQMLSENAPFLERIDDLEKRVSDIESKLQDDHK